MRRLISILLAIGSWTWVRANEIRPWETVRQFPKPGTVLPLTNLLDRAWKANSGDERTLSVVPVEGGRALDWKPQVDHRDESPYPLGWLSFETRLKTGLDFSSRRAIFFRMRSLKDTGRAQNVRFILAQDDKRSINVPLPAIRPGDWRTVAVTLPEDRRFTAVTRIHFYICEADFADGDALEFQFRDFSLADVSEETVPLATGEAGATLWVGARGDASREAVLLSAGTASLPATVHVDSRLARPIPADAEVRFRLRELFSGQETVRLVPLGREIASGMRAKVCLAVDLRDLPGGYYHILADVLINGKSVLGIRKGSDDFYLMTAGESMTHAILSFRTGLAAWVSDRLNGGFMNRTRALPPAYDPFDARPAAYAEFLRHFAVMSFATCEAYEAGMGGLTIAAEAFRRTGETDRQHFAEDLLWSGCKALLRMQDACGGIITKANPLADAGLAEGGPSDTRDCFYLADQTAEAMHALASAALHFLRRGGEAEKVRRLNAALRRSGDFLFVQARKDVDGVSGVIKNLELFRRRDGTFRPREHFEEGHLCDVYQPRVLGGMAAAAIAFIRSGEPVPNGWLDAFVRTRGWMDRKMKPNGWFDWPCGFTTEGGCHTFLGNLYAGEGLFNAALALRLAGRVAEAQAAFKTAHRAYRYVTDDCRNGDWRYQYPLEFWVGPYVCWLFAEWERHVGPDPVFRDWLVTMDRKWRVDRQWGDFVRRPGMDCGRAKGNGLLTLAILGYLGLRDMEERGNLWTLFD